MKRAVSRLTDRKPCANCGNEPRRAGQRWGNDCFAEYQRHQRALDALERKAGRVIRLRLTPEEQAVVMRMRETAARRAGRQASD